MAEQRRSRSRNGSDSQGGGSGRSSRQSRSQGASSGISAGQVVQRVREEFPRLLGRPVESVLGIQHDGDGSWHVNVQVVELARIPSSTDVLGVYEVMLDDDGQLSGYQRRRRYNRGQPDED